MNFTKVSTLRIADTFITISKQQLKSQEHRIAVTYIIWAQNTCKAFWRDREHQNKGELGVEVDAEIPV